MSRRTLLSFSENHSEFVPSKRVNQLSVILLLMMCLLQAQPHCMSSMVVFKYKAAPVSTSGSTVQAGEEEDASDQDEEQGTFKAIIS